MGAILLYALLALTGPGGDGHRWGSYENPRYGTRLAYPADLFGRGVKSANGDGVTLRAADGATLAIFPAPITSTMTRPPVMSRAWSVTVTAMPAFPIGWSDRASPSFRARAAGGSSTNAMPLSGAGRSTPSCSNIRWRRGPAMTGWSRGCRPRSARTCLPPKFG